MAGAARPWVGVTTVIEVIDKGDGVLRWANRHGLEGRTLEQARETRGTGEGSKVHLLWEHLAAGQDRIMFGDGTGYSPNYGPAFMAWWDGSYPEGRPPRPLAAEVNLQSERHRVRGRADGARVCDRPGCACFGEGVILVDFKSGYDRSYYEMHVQLDGYRELWPETPKPAHLPDHVCDTEVVLLPKGGVPIVVPGEARRGAFLDALALYRDRAAFRAAR